MICEKAERWIDGVMNGTIIAGRLTRLAVERHLHDLEQADERGWYFDRASAEHALSFIETLRVPKGRYAKEPFILHPSQAFVVYSIFGWKNKRDGTRRFRKAYVRVSRKWGKSLLCAAIGLYMLICDGEFGAEIYSAALKRDQARKVWDAAASMLKDLRRRSKAMRKMAKVFDSVNNLRLVFTPTESEFVPLSKDYDTEEGSNPHCAIIDELHLHPTTGVVDMLETGMLMRRQPLLFQITTAGFDTSAPCYEYEQSVVAMLEGDNDMDTTFALIFSLDDGDDWRDERNWYKANPHLGDLMSLDDFRAAFQRAVSEGVTSERKFRVKNLNQWLTEAAGWISEDHWRRGAQPLNWADFEGRTAYLGIDLASTRDLTALCILFPPEHDGDPFAAFWRFYCPEAALTNPKRNDGRVAYRKWAKEGYLIPTPGNAVDYQAIYEDIIEISKHVEIAGIGHDAWNRASLFPRLEEDFKIVPVPQNYSNLSFPMKQVEALVAEGRFLHGDNPVVNWMLGNLVVMMDPNENIKPDRKRKKDKIDGIAALLDAFNVYLRSFGEPDDLTISDLMSRIVIR